MTFDNDRRKFSLICYNDRSDFLQKPFEFSKNTLLEAILQPLNEKVTLVWNHSAADIWHREACSCA